MHARFAGRLAAAALIVGLGAVPAAAATLKASHQWPSGTGDFRDEMIQMIAKEVAAAGVDLDVKIFPGSSLVKPRDQWNALAKGQIDIALFPLDYAAGKNPEFSATLMPGLVKNHEHARRLSASPFMADIKKIVEDAGIVVIADGWLAGGFASKKTCILEPDDAKGQVMRAAGPMFEKMLAGAGASLASMPSSEIYTAMQTGVLDGANTSSESFSSYRLHEQVKCMTPPGEHALWFMYEPLLMSKKTFDSLKPEQRDALMAAAKKAEDYGYRKAEESDKEMVDRFTKAGVEIVYMTEPQADAWRKLAAETSYKAFADEVKGGKELLDKALAVK
ncbi:TRAP transporter substrate-binding protein DctP [Azospirillum sp. ST 5-10]|uniref:TRAP transporter substrate-binding protein DctP n=1 Tax=unclassified Azospirillum TaxID=2630922 RepID=UPI003F4A6F58